MTTRTQDSTGAGISRIIAATSFGFVVTQLDVTIVNVALSRIASGLSVHVAGLQWVVDAYTLPFAVLMLSAGVLGDRFGSRRAYLVGLAIFAAASLACGLAPNVATLIAARAVQGAGGALLIPSSLALLNHAAANDHGLRARAVGLWTAAGSVAIAAGPVAGGLLVASMGWRSIFLVNLPLCAIGIALDPAVGSIQRSRGCDAPSRPARAIACDHGHYRLDVFGHRISSAGNRPSAGDRRRDSRGRGWNRFLSSRKQSRVSLCFHSDFFACRISVPP